MEFNIKKWRKYYNEITFLSGVLRDSEDRLNEYGICVKAKNYLSKETKLGMEHDIDNLLKQTSKYLDQCNLAVQIKKFQNN